MNEVCSFPDRYAADSLWANAGVGMLLILGRILAATVEVWAIVAYMKSLVHQDASVTASALDDVSQTKVTSR